jgi:predicted metalloendopeptidase
VACELTRACVLHCRHCRASAEVSAAPNGLTTAEWRAILDSLARLGKPVDRGQWWMAPATVNAYYSPRLNEIVFPAGILQPPFFDLRRDDAMNYGAIGMVIGHEITHGFDDHGRKFDAAGNRNDWWTPEDAERYARRADAVVRQYDRFVGVEGLHLNGKLTLGENIGDLGGLKIAYLALQHALARHPQPVLDGMTPDQRFFVSFARVWRFKETPESERLLITTNPHPPPRFRVAGPLAGMPEFAAAFSCDAAGAGERSTIW